MNHLDVRLGKHFNGHGIRITILITDLANSCVDNHLAADAAWLGGAKKGGIFYGNPMQSCLDNCVLFCMNAPAELMAFTRWHL